MVLQGINGIIQFDTMIKVANTRNLLLFIHNPLLLIIKHNLIPFLLLIIVITIIIKRGHHYLASITHIPIIKLDVHN